jgi:hypothetical protein
MALGGLGADLAVELATLGIDRQNRIGNGFGSILDQAVQTVVFPHVTEEVFLRQSSDELFTAPIVLGKLPLAGVSHGAELKTGHLSQDQQDSAGIPYMPRVQPMGGQRVNGVQQGARALYQTLPSASAHAVAPFGRLYR